MKRARRRKAEVKRREAQRNDADYAHDIEIARPFAARGRNAACFADISIMIYTY